jgi:hypothetical protein
MVKAQYNYYISGKDLKGCDKEENMAVIGAAAVSCFKRRL